MKAQAGEQLRELRWQKGETQAYWPLEYRKKFGFSILKTPDITPYTGPWFDFPDDISDQNKIKYLKEGIDALFNEMPKCDVLSVRLHPGHDYFLPFHWNNCELSPRVTYRIDSDLSLEQIQGNMKSSNRRNLKKAQNNVEILRVDQINGLWQMSQKTFERQGKKPHFSKGDLQRVYEAASERDRTLVLEAREENGTLHSAALFVADDRYIYYYKGGSDPEFRDSHAFTAIIWEGLKWSRERGVGFDFEGSMIEPIERFFRSWGAEPVTYFQIQRFRNKWIKALFDLR